jgi:hypothetical protein
MAINTCDYCCQQMFDSRSCCLQMQLKQARGQIRRAQADLTLAKSDARLGNEDVKRCQTIKQQIKSTLEQVR